MKLVRVLKGSERKVNHIAIEMMINGWIIDSSRIIDKIEVIMTKIVPDDENIRNEDK